MPVVALADVVAAARQPDVAGGTRVIGVDGPAGSGKTTLARRLASLLSAPIVATDDFLSWTDLETWWPRFESDALGPLLAGQDARYQVRDWHGDPEGDSLKHWKTTRWAPTVVLDGVTSTRRAIADRLAYRIWVEAPDPLRLERGLARDGDYWLRHWDDWVRLESAFFRADGTRARADLVVDGDPAEVHDPDTELVSR